MVLWQGATVLLNTSINNLCCFHTFPDNPNIEAYFSGFSCFYSTFRLCLNLISEWQNMTPNKQDFQYLRDQGSPALLTTNGLLTLRGLGAYIFLDQGICRLSVKAKSIFKGLHIRALFQEGFLQPVSSSVEVLLQERRRPAHIYSFSRHARLWHYLLLNLLPLRQSRAAWDYVARCILQGGVHKETPGRLH